jgi:riboflavin transporter FmnP
MKQYDDAERIEKSAIEQAEAAAKAEIVETAEAVAEASDEAAGAAEQIEKAETAATGETAATTSKKRSGKLKFVYLAMFAALSIAFVTLIHFPFPFLPGAQFLEYDPADVPILIGTFAFGPLSGLLLTLVVAVVQGVTVSAASGPWGILMHFLATGSMALVAGLVYRRFHTFKGAIAALCAGAATMTLVMIPLNLLITPIYTGASVQVVAGMLLPAIIPFNAIKSVVNCAITFLVYKHISRLIDKTI